MSYDVDQVDCYNQTGLDETFEPSTTPETPTPRLWIPPQRMTNRPAPSDALSFATYLVPDSTAATPQSPVRIHQAQPNGVASKVRLHIVRNAASTANVYLLTDESLFGLIKLHTGTHWYIDNGVWIGQPTNGSTSPIEFVTAGELWAVSLTAVAGEGALVTVASEIYFPER